VYGVGSVSLMTRDHSAMAALRSEATAAGGQVAIDAFELHHQNVLTRALGMTSAIQPDITLRNARGGDRYLLCSAGLWMQMPEAQLGRAVAQARNAEDACQGLRALVRGYDFGYALAALDLGGGSVTSRA
jgi:serine/threonine protein phosphatase PrpC